MSKKHIKLEEDVRVLYNKAKAKFLTSNPKIKKVSDNIIMKAVFIKYLEG
jgi:hypothetical protein